MYSCHISKVCLPYTICHHWLLLQVQIVDGPLLHSKKNGDGYVDTTEKMDKM